MYYIKVTLLYQNVPRNYTTFHYFILRADDELIIINFPLTWYLVNNVFHQAFMKKHFTLSYVS